MAKVNVLNVKILLGTQVFLKTETYYLPFFKKLLFFYYYLPFRCLSVVGNRFNKIFITFYMYRLFSPFKDVGLPWWLRW